MATERIEIPIFTGDDLRQWIDWLIDFFEREQFTGDDDKLNFTQSFMEGEARAWFIQRTKTMIFRSWDELKRSLFIRFGRYDDPERINILREQNQRWKTLKNSWNPSFQAIMALNRIESNAIAPQSNGKEIGEPLISQPQVTNLPRIDDLEIESLGYRGNLQESDNQESLLKKTELPAFDGFMPYGWICRVERFFRVVKYSEEDKLYLVHLSLVGDARDWYSEEVINGEFITWFSFKKRLLARFAPEENGFPSDVSTHVLKIVQDPVLKSAKNVESTSNEALQAASETCSNTLQEPSYGLVLEALSYEVGSDGLCAQEGEEPYILQVQTEDELTPPSIDSESIHYVPKLVNKKFLRDTTRKHMRKQRLSPKSWRFKYKKRMKMNIKTQLLGSAMVKASRVSWLQKRKTPLLLRSNVKEDDILVEMINGMDSVTNDVSGYDVLVRFPGKNDASVNKKKTKRYHQTRDVRDKEAARVDYAEVQRFADVLLTHSEREQIQHRKRCYKTWHFKYKDEREDFLSFKFTQKSGVTEKWESLLLNLLVWYFTLIGKGDYIAVWHCWNERNLMQSRELSLYFSPANGMMKSMGLDIKALGVKQVVSMLIHKCVRFGVTIMFGNCSIALVNAETLLTSASWRRAFTLLVLWYMVPVVSDGESDQYCAVLRFNTDVMSDQQKNESWMDGASTLRVWKCRLLKKSIITSLVWHRWKTKDQKFTGF